MIRKIFRGGFAAGVLGLGALSLGSSLGSAAELRAVELSASDDGAQLTLDLSEGAQHKLFTLEHPDRVVVDLPNTHLADGVRAPGPEGVVTEVRFGAQPDGTLRVVAELRSALAAHSGWAPGEGHRLILTIGAPVAEAAPKAVRTPHAPGEGDRDVIIAVDAGHGGDDPGAIGRGGTREKDVTLAIARALAQRVDAEPGMRAVLTRDRDEFLELRERIRRAHAAHADMFISVHADSIRDRRRPAQLLHSESARRNPFQAGTPREPRQRRGRRVRRHAVTSQPCGRVSPRPDRRVHCGPNADPHPSR